jgi:hypothetical protein
MNPKVDELSASLALKDMADAFGIDDLSVLLPIAMDCRIFLDGDKALYTFRTPIELLNGEKVSSVRLREPSAADFLAYSKGMTVTVSRDGATNIDMVMIGKRTIHAVARLSGQPDSIIERMSRRDLDDMTKVGDALGFFD